MALHRINDEARGKLKAKSAQSLPDVPSLHNWTPKQFKNAITKCLFDNQDSFVDHINKLADSVEDQMLQAKDEKVYLFEKEFTSINEFALACLTQKAQDNFSRLYLGKYNGTDVVAICKQNMATIISGEGNIVTSNGRETSQLELTELYVDNYNLKTGKVYSMQVDNYLDASNAVVKLPQANLLNPPSQQQAVPKMYVDDVQNKLQEQINVLEAAQNLLDIVGTYKTGNDSLLSYPETNLKYNDKIKVLKDETKNNAGTYYKWTNENTGVFHWEYIGEDGEYYTKQAVDGFVAGLQAQIDSLKALVTTLTASNVSYKED